MGNVVDGLMDHIRPGRPVHPRDLRFFWKELDRQGLAGTLDRPVHGSIPDVEAIAADAVRRLLGLRSAGHSRPR